MNGTADRMVMQPSRRAIVAATIGNALEFYDFVTYGIFAIQIGHAFFPSHGAYGSLMASLATLGVGFVTRPIGAAVIGIYADRVGRRPAMMFSFTLMGASIISLALIPSYAAIGVAAPVLAVVARMAQGFSLGGEVGPTTAYLLETAPPDRRGLAVAWQGASQNFAAAVAGLVGLGLSSLLPPAALDSYGWRIALLLGAVTLPFGLWLRRGLPESLHLPGPAPGNATVHDPAIHAAPDLGPSGLALAWAHRRILGLTLLTMAGLTVGAHVVNYMVTFAQNTLRLSPGVSFLANAAGNVAGVVAALLGGWLADRIGRRALLIWPNLMFLVVVLPIFFWIIATRDALALVIGSTVFGFLNSLNGGAFFAAVTEALPRRIRAGAFAIVYASTIALFGGATQFAVNWLIHVTGNPMSPALCLFAATLVAQIALTLIGIGPRAGKGPGAGGGETPAFPAMRA